KAFTNWAGWLLPYDRDFALIVDDRVSAQDIARDLALIGLDRLQGYFPADALQGRDDLQTVQTVNTEQMANSAGGSENAVVIDVRNSNERAAGHIPGTIHIPLGYLPDRARELPRDRPIIVHCQSGSRSAIAAGV